jgi:hypothetical protein
MALTCPVEEPSTASKAEAAAVRPPVRGSPHWLGLVVIFSFYSKFSRAGAHLNGEARKIGAQASSGPRNAVKTQTCACGCRSKKTNC